MIIANICSTTLKLDNMQDAEALLAIMSRARIITRKWSDHEATYVDEHRGDMSVEITAARLLTLEAYEQEQAEAKATKAAATGGTRADAIDR